MFLRLITVAMIAELSYRYIETPVRHGALGRAWVALRAGRPIGVRRVGVAVVNVRVPRAWEAPNNAVLGEGVQRYPNTVLVDWHGATTGRPELFWDDGIHLRPDGAALYAALIAAAVQN